MKSVWKNDRRDVFGYLITYTFKITFEKSNKYYFFCAQHFEYKLILHCFDNVLFYMFSAKLKHTIKQKILPDKTGEKNVVSDLTISAKQYPKIVSLEKKKFQ